MPGSGSYPGSVNQPSSGWFRGSPFLQGLAGGVAGGFLGNMLFGGRGGNAAGSMGGSGGGGIGLFDIIILGLLLYFGYKFYKRWRLQKEGTSFYGDVVSPRIESSHGTTRDTYAGTPQDSSSTYDDDLERGWDQIKRIDPSFNEESFKELVQDMFFRIQAGWMNRSLEGVENLLTPEMTEFFKKEFEGMKQKGRINRLENIAVRKVEISEAWQETGKDYVTVFFTDNLLDYTVDDKTGQVVGGDKLNPVKFQEFWTFCRDIGSSRWQLSAINQVGEPVTRH
jgi:predicted lipid-binding transport protein (Tim44 family)